MRLLTTAIANTLLLLLGMIALASEETQSAALDYHFRAAPIEPPDQRTLDRYRRRPSNVQCNLVEFSVDQLVDLILRVDSGQIPVTASSITFSPFDQNGVRFVGIYSSVKKDDGEHGPPYVWTGRLPDRSYFKASLVITDDKRLTGIIDTPEGVYSLTRSHWSGNQFLCEIKDAFVPRKID